MSVFVIGNYVTFSDTAGIKKRYQNFFSQGEATLEGEKYQLLPFLYQGATKTKNGDNISSQLILPTNQLTLAWTRDAVNNNWVVEVRTYQLTDSYTPITPPLGQEIWLCTGMSYSTQSTQLELSSPLDAIQATVPNLRFTAKQVGALPTTGAIRSG